MDLNKEYDILFDLANKKDLNEHFIILYDKFELDNYYFLVTELCEVNKI